MVSNWLTATKRVLVRCRYSAVLAMLLVLPAGLPYSTPSPIVAPSTPVRGVEAMGPAADTGRAEPGAELSVSLVTTGQGDEIWEKFGHSAIWIHDARTGTDVAYNWGLFDFAQPGFVRRFLRGQMLYWMAGLDEPEMVSQYVAANRSVWVQRLHLSPRQRQALRDFVEWNERPENRYYRYDYYRDNCSTRVRDALDRVLGGQIRAATDTVATGTTFRWHTRRLMTGDLAAYTGIELGLGQPGDRPISAWEEMFLPVPMHDMFNRLRVRDPATEESVPLVESDREVYDSTRPPESTGPPHWLMGYLIAGALLGAVFALLGYGAAAGDRAARVGLATLGSVWSLVIGLLGTALVFLWAFTDHVFTRWNENVLQANPLSLVLAVLIPLSLYKGWRGRSAMGVALTLAALSLTGLLLKALPWFDQVNGESIALLLPTHVGLVLGLAALRGLEAPTAAPAIEVTPETLADTQDDVC